MTGPVEPALVPEGGDAGAGTDQEPGLGRATTVITFWNLVSRLTGFVRVIATASALGIAALGDTYQRANQVSNVLFELLAGGMLFSVLVPSFVGELRRGSRDDARQLAGALATRAIAALSLLVVVGMLFSRPIIELLSSGADASTRAAQVELGTFLLWFVLPQLLLYTLGSVASALLQADHRFAATSLAPALNNVVVTVTMVAFAVTHDPAAGLTLTLGEKVLLGGGTLLGTAAMTIVPLVALRRGGLGIGPRWRVPNADLGSLARRGLWGAGHVGLNQVLVMATVVLCGWVDGGVIAYQTAFTFFLLPHALLGHPIFTALFPRLSRQGAAEQYREFGATLGQGLRSMLFLLLPAGGLLAVAALPSLSTIRFGALTGGGTRMVAVVLGAYLVGLVGYSTFFLLTRASYALEDPRQPTIVNLGVTVGTVVGMVVATTVWEGTGLLVSFGLITSAFACSGSLVLYRNLRRKIGQPVPILATFARCAAAAVVAVGAAAAVTNLIGWHSTFAAVTAAASGSLVGLVLYVVVLRGLGEPELTVFQERLARLSEPLRRFAREPYRLPALRIGLALAVLTLIFGSLVMSQAREPRTEAGGQNLSRVVVFAVPGLSIEDLEAGLMPNLDQVAETGSIAVANVRIDADRPDVVGAYASLGAGNRVRSIEEPPAVYSSNTLLEGGETAGDVTARKMGRAVTGDLVIPDYGDTASILSPEGSSPLGGLADALAEGGRTVALVSNVDTVASTGPGHGAPAGLAASTSSGEIAHGSVSPRLLRTVVVDDEEVLVANPVAYGKAVRDAQAQSDLVIVDAGETTRADAASRAAREAEELAEAEAASTTTTPPASTSTTVPLAEQADTRRDEALKLTDAVLGQVRRNLRPGTLLMVVGVTPPGDDWALTPVVVVGRGIPHGYLDSTSTHRPALVTLTDLAPTILGTLATPVPSSMIGQPLRYRASDSSWSEARTLDQLLKNREKTDATMTVSFIVANSVLYALVVLLLVVRRRLPPRSRPALEFGALACGAWPVATYLLRIGTSLYSQRTASIVLSWLIAAALASIARRFRSHPLDPVLAVSALTVAVLVLDLATGAHLQVGSLFGYMPHTAPRFVGIGNAGFAILAGATIVLIGALLARATDKAVAWSVAVAIAAVVVIADGAPWMGTDVGGILALVPVLGLTLWALRGHRIRWQTLVVAGTLAVAVLAVAVGIDGLRPEADRTHIGRFFLNAGDGSNFMDTIRRKWRTNVADLRASPLVWFVPILAVGGLVLGSRSPTLRRVLPRRSPVRVAVLATIAAGIVGWLVNDSGVIVLALTCVPLGPLLVLLISTESLDASTAAVSAKAEGAANADDHHTVSTPPRRSPVPESRTTTVTDPMSDARETELGSTATNGEIVVAIVPAKDRSDSIAATVAALRALGRVDRVIVVDDGSTDDTSEVAGAAGAEVVRLARNRGKGGAVLAGVDATPEATVYLLIDADLARTASAADALLEPVLSDEADLTIGVLPSAGKKGGFGTIRSLSAAGIRRACGLEVEAPLSGQRAIRAGLLRGLRDAERFGLEVAMTIDVARSGARVLEIPVPMDHRHTGRKLSGFAHRGRQGLDIARSLWPRLTTARQRIGLVLVGTILLAGLAVVAGSRSVPPSEVGGTGAKKVVLFGLNPYELSDLSAIDTPNLHALMERGSVGAMSVRTVARVPSSAEGFLAIGSGARLSIRGNASLFLPADESVGSLTAGEYVTQQSGKNPTGAYVGIGGPAIARANKGPAAAGHPGFLADQLAKHDLRTSFVGSYDRPELLDSKATKNRPAALATMRSDFSTDGVVADLTVEDRTAPYGIRSDPKAVAQAVLDELDGSALVVVDPGDLDRADDFAANAQTGEARKQKIEAAKVTDDVLGRVLDGIDPDTLVIVVSLRSDAGPYHLQPTVVAGPNVPRGTLQSASTKRDGLVALTDVAPTILAALGVDKPTDVPGNAFRYDSAPVDLAELRSLDRDTDVRERTYYGQSWYFIVAHFVVYVLALFVLTRNSRFGQFAGWIRWLALALASYPMTSFLVRLVPRISAVFLAQVLLAVALAVLLGWFFATRRSHPLAPLQWLTGATTAVIVFDTWLGTPMQMSSWLGSSMHNAGRFYGIPNSTFAVLGACSIIWGAIYVDRSSRRSEATIVVACVFFLTLVSAGLPMLGADVGTLMTLSPVYALLLVSWFGRRIRVRTAVIAGLSMVAVVVLAALGDLARPKASRTHLGQFAQRVLDEGPSALYESFARKQSANFRILGGSVWSELLPIIIVFVLWILVWDRRWPELFPPGSARRVGFIGVIGAALLGFATNDSGPIVVALFASYLAPFVAIALIGRDDPPALTNPDLDPDGRTPTRRTPVTATIP